MKPKVYIESSVISYLTARPSNDLVKAARQAITETWWTDNLHYYSVYVLELVEQEIARSRAEFKSKRKNRLK
jgi:predicted nucleic acid-binding protein